MNQAVTATSQRRRIEACIRENKAEELRELLAEEPYLLTPTSERDQQEFLVALMLGHSDVIALFLEYGFDANRSLTVTGLDVTNKVSAASYAHVRLSGPPLMFAILVGQPDMVDFLIAHGADPSDPTILVGFGAGFGLHLFGSADYRQQVQAFSRVVAGGGDPMAKDASGRLMPNVLSSRSEQIRSGVAYNSGDEVAREVVERIAIFLSEYERLSKRLTPKTD
jgi:hypothetical protein